MKITLRNQSTRIMCALCCIPNANTSHNTHISVWFTCLSYVMKSTIEKVIYIHICIYMNGAKRCSNPIKLFICFRARRATINVIDFTVFVVVRCQWNTWINISESAMKRMNKKREIFFFLFWSSNALQLVRVFYFDDVALWFSIQYDRIEYVHLFFDDLSGYGCR